MTDPRTCFWRHRWSRWEDKQTLVLHGPGLPAEAIIGRSILQERRCERCNMVELRMEEASL